MLETSSNQLFDKVVRITQVYLGPAAERFITRQIRNHLHKTPDNLSHEDLLSLIDWIRVAVSMLTEDIAIVEEYANQLERLARPQTNSKRSFADNAQ